MAIEVFNRFEHKYLINKKTFNEMIKTLDEHMVPDAYNEKNTPYTISNIYFDTPDDYLIRASLSHPEYKEKLRLRSYGALHKDSEVFIEIKKKFNGLVNKRRTALRLSEAYRFLETGTPPSFKDYMNPQVIKEIEYFLKIYNLSPKVVISYDRIAYFEKNNNDLRISFDMNIRARRDKLLLEEGDYGKRLIPEEVYLMEIKTALAKPLWLTRMLTELNIKRSRFSKYGTEYQNMINEIKLKEVI